MKKILLSITLVLSISVSAQTTNVFHLGHSLVSPYMPSMLQTLCDSSGINHHYDIGIINGAPLFWHWDNSSTCQGYQASTIDSRIELASGNYDVFVMIEGSTWDNIIPDFYSYADSFHSAALAANSTIQTYLYEGWNCLDTGLPGGCPDDYSDSLLWVPRVRQDIATWESVMDSLNALHPGAPPVYIIPAAQALANLSDSIVANAVPGLSDFRNDLFEDDIHPNDTAFYFIALVHYACIYKQTPVGLPIQTFGEWGGAFNPPSAAMALKLQEIAWETVCNYPFSGVNCGPTYLDNMENDVQLTLFPNPSNGQLYVKSKKVIDEIVIYNLSGKIVTSAKPKQYHLDVRLSPGFYFSKVLISGQSYINKIIIE